MSSFALAVLALTGVILFSFLPASAQSTSTFQITDSSGNVLPHASAWYISGVYCAPNYGPPSPHCSYYVDKRIGTVGAVRVDTENNPQECPPYSRSLSSGYTTGTGANCLITYGPEQIAHLNLRFQILGVDYAPPGARSNVNYGNSAMRGTSTSDTNTWATSVTQSLALTAGLDLAGLAHGTVSGTNATTYNQEADSTSSITLTTTTSNADIVYGPLSSSAGIDHNYDVIWVWLNPIATLVLESNANANAVLWTGYAFNAEDNANEMEVVPLYVKWLRNPSTIPANVATRLARSWDVSGNGGLTAADYATILAADPFSSTTYNPNSDSGHRFDLQGSQTFTYEPPPAGGQPITQTFSIATQSTSSFGQSSQNTYSTSFTVDFNTGLNILGVLGADAKVTNVFTTTDKWSSIINNATGRTASLSITGPAATDGYKGPTTIQVWRDNVYGSFMFQAVP